MGTSYLDPRLACLTLGDSGVAMVVEGAPDVDVGFHALDLFTLGRYSGVCIARPTEREHGGWIMHTDALRFARISIKHDIAHAGHVFRRYGWAPDSFDHLIMHQTSKAGVDHVKFFEGIGQQAIKDQLKANTDEVMARGGFGSPTIFVGKTDMYFGNDRMPLVREALERLKARAA
jgi:hypothetical protein